MKLTRRSSLAARRGLTTTYRWVTVWLIAGAVLALLLLANSVRDYLFVWRILAVQQARRELSQQMVALEQKIRRSSTPGPSLLELLGETADSASDTAGTASFETGGSDDEQSGSTL